MATYQAFDPEEIEFLTKLREKNDKTEDYFKISREKWETEIKPLLDYSNIEFNAKSAQKIMEAQLQALAFRQNLIEEISFLLNKRSKEDVKLKKLKQDKLIWYAIGSSLMVNKKFNASQTTEIVEAHTAELVRSIELIEVHIEFLRWSAKGLDNLGYFIKNMIEYHNMLLRN